MQTLFSQDEIAGRVAELGREISSFYQNKELTLIVILNGAIPFAADLMRHISIPMWVDSIAVQSYCNDASSGQVKFRSQLKLPVENLSRFHEPGICTLECHDSETTAKTGRNSG